MTTVEEIRQIADSKYFATRRWLLRKAAEEIEALEEERNMLRIRVEELNKHFADAANERDDLRRQNAELRECLQNILRYPVHSEPVGGAMAMQDIAFKALAVQPEGGAR